MKTGQAGIDLIKKFEGCRLTAYKCPAGVWTIGYGHTAGVKPGDKITVLQAEEMLKSDLASYEKKVDKYTNKYRWNQNEFDALVSFAYNIGSIDQLTANGTRDRKTIAEKFVLYNKAGGKVLSGLTKRRMEEKALFIKASNVLSLTVKKGSKGPEVFKLQKLLTVKGYGVGTIDGIFGIKTLESVKAFQADYGLTIDGIVGTKTWAALG